MVIDSIYKKSGKFATIDAFINAPFFNPEKMSHCLKDQLFDIIEDYSFWHWSHEDPAIYIDPPAAKQVNKLDLPTLIITAEFDIGSCREIADIFYENIPNSKKFIIENATHFMLMEKPDEFNKIVVKFLNDLNN